ncbi:MAG: orotidine-5'-phosphate decarboxylase [Clostridia bacterium]|nr:orotidine-5'-phosphate decarboxylase [Clostridia bacterium]
MSLDRLIEGIIKTKNPTVAGLDAKLEYIPEFIKEKNFAEYSYTLEGAAASMLEFNKGLIDALCDIVPAIKPQCAYYELLGWQGMKTLAETIEYAHSKGMYVITDGKRNDIGSTMEAYASGHLGKIMVGDKEVAPFDGDALTVNGYLGTDTIAPLLDVCNKYDKGIFVLVKTSNPSSGELQDKLLKEEDTTIYHHMGTMCSQWGESLQGKYGYTGIGAVVGATYPKQLTELRAAFPKIFFLVPGYGAQGAGGQDIAGAFDDKGLGAIVNASRSIMCAYKKNNYDEKDFAEAARAEAIRMRDDITQYLPKF